MAIKPGDKIENFILEDQDGKDITLSDFKGKKVLLSFHPLAFTGVCSRQMKALDKNYKRFKELNTVALGVSVDPSPSKKAWAKELGIENTKLLSDFWMHGDLANKLGIFDEKNGVDKRANIIIDENGIVKWIKIYSPDKLPDIEEVFREIEK